MPRRRRPRAGSRAAGQTPSFLIRGREHKDGGENEERKSQSQFFSTAIHQVENSGAFIRAPFARSQVAPMATAPEKFHTAPPRASNDRERDNFFSPRLVSSPSSSHRPFVPDAGTTQWFRPVSYSYGKSSSEREGSPPLARSSSHLSGKISTSQKSPSRLRRRLSSAGSGDSMESTESFSSCISPFRSSVDTGMITTENPGAKKKFVRSLSSPIQQSAENDDDKSSKSPLPQNLRGDPFRSAKVKTELCRHFETAKGCPFGDKCNYAHGAHELKYTKLIDLERAGLIDVEIFRTHACPTWVATGACPFDQRCSGLHDSRVAGSSPSWLPHAETLVNSIGSGVNVDKLYHEQLSAVYSCSPIYGYVPPGKWKSDAIGTRCAWEDFYAFVCNLERDSFPGSVYQFHFSHDEASRDHKTASELHRVLIALKMRERKLGQCYAYLPSHLLFGELCMVLQSRSFRIVDDRGNGDRPALIEIDMNEGSSEISDGEKIIEAHEIAFGPVGDPGVRQVSVWFNVKPNDIVTCTPQQAKRHKRSRHRLKKKRQPEKLIDVASTAVKASQSTDSTEDVTKIDIDNPPFHNYQPIDSSAFDLITDILRHRAHVLDILSRKCPVEKKNSTLNVLRAYECRMQLCFESQRRYWMTWSWPVSIGRGILDENTDVPPVNGEYRFVGGKQSVHMKAFHGRDDGSGSDIVSNVSKLATGFVWKSFVYNMQLGNVNRIENAKDGVELPQDAAFARLCRLPVLRSLSRGINPGNYRGSLPKIRREAHTNQNVGIAGSPKYTAVSTITALFREWNAVKDHYVKNQHSPLRNTQTGKKMSDSSASVSISSQIFTGSSASLEDALEEASKSWKRMPD